MRNDVLIFHSYQRTVIMMRMLSHLLKAALKADKQWSIDVYNQRKGSS